MAVMLGKLSGRPAMSSVTGLMLGAAGIWFAGAWAAGALTPNHTVTSSPLTVSAASKAATGAEYSVDEGSARIQLMSTQLALPASTSGSAQGQRPQSPGSCGIFQKQPQLFELPPCDSAYSTPRLHSPENSAGGGGGHSPVHSSGGGGHSVHPPTGLGPGRPEA